MSLTSPPDDPVAPSTAEDAAVHRQGAPTVVAVVVTRDPGPSFDEAMESLAAQDYPTLSILVVDAGSAEDVTPRVAEVAPSAFVRRSEQPLSFAEATEGVLGTVEGAAFYLFCHDDTALEEGAVQALVAEAFRSNAGIVGAKLVDWDDPERLRSVGARVDRFAYPAPISEPGELDQAQHDVAQEVFLVSSAAMLVRADLFGDLAGFDPTVDLVAAELDLCWRARVAGARTVVAPSAVARHASRSPVSDPDAEEARRSHRAQARVLFTCASTATLLRVVPVAAVLSILDLLLNLVTGRLSNVRDIGGAWVWNVVHLPRTLAARRRTQRRRRTSDREIALQQVRGSARIAAYFRRARSSGEVRLPAAIAAARGLPAQWHEGSGGLALGGLAAIALVLLLGSRGILTDGATAMRELAPLTDPGALMRHWWDGWRPAGTGHAAPAPLLHLVVGLADKVTFGSGGFVRTLLVLLPLFLGPIGAWRMMRGAGSSRARLAATAAYAAVPVAMDAVAEGRLAAIGLYGAMPWILGRLLRIAAGAGGDATATPMTGPVDERRMRSPGRAGAGLGLVVAAAMLVAPLSLAVLLVTALVVAIVQADGGVARVRRVLVTTAVATVVALLVHLPSAVDLLANRDRWSAPWAGGTWREVPSLRRLFQLSVGPTPGGWLFLGLAIAAVLVLLVGRGWRLRWGITGWALAVASWLSVAALARWGGDGSLPSLSFLLVPAALGLALAIGSGVAAFEADVMGSVFGWRQVGSAVALVAVLAGLLPFLVASADGRWRSPNLGVASSLTALAEDEEGTGRALWLGVPGDLPGAAHVIDGGVGVLLTDRIVPTFDDAASWPMSDEERDLLADVEQLQRAETRTAGEALARYEVGYVIVLRSPDGRTSVEVPQLAPLLDVLGEQLDLRPVEVSPGMDVYRTGDVDEPADRGEGGGGHRLLVVLQLVAIVAAAAVAGSRRRAPAASMTEAVDSEEVAQ